MTPGFYIVMAAQFFSALADNALLTASMALLQEMNQADSSPLLKWFFTISYVVLAPFVGAFADSMPKWRVMFISNSIKILGCSMMFFGVHPLAAYAMVGLGAAAYSPAKYGIVTELLPQRMLVAANGWIEGLTVAAIVFGTALGGMLISDKLIHLVRTWHLPGIFSGAYLAMSVVGLLYVVAAVINLKVPDTGVDHKPLSDSPFYLLREFWHCQMLLWRDKLGQISLAVTTLFWGAGATLQFIVIKWGEQNLGLNLSKASMIQAIVAIGVATGAVLAARLISMRRSVSVIPLGIVMGLLVNVMVFVHNIWFALVLMILIGALAGFFVVPMNALLQHRGHVLMGAGHSIAVQNFNENAGILIMVGLYYLLTKIGLSVHAAIALFGVFVATTMYLVKRRHVANQRAFDHVAQLDDRRH